MTEIKKEIVKLESALNYAKIGIKVFPCHSIKDGKCTCDKKNTCKSQGKHPMTKNGVLDATTDESIINDWWTKVPDANIGGATGSTSGIVVIDLDTKHGKSTQEMITEMSDKGFNLPPTVTSLTGEYKKGRGLHYIYKAPKNLLKSTTNILKDHGIEGVDIRAESGYIIMPPSNHISGVEYELLNETENLYENN